jgi:hypothetical protein
VSLGDRRPAKRTVGTHGRKRWDHRQRRRRRELGQNFLKNRRIARQIVAESGVEKDDLVVELGAGGRDAYPPARKKSPAGDSRGV